MYTKSANKSGTIRYMCEWPLHKKVLLLVLKLITVREGIPTADDITGVSPWHHQQGESSQ